MSKKRSPEYLVHEFETRDPFVIAAGLEIPVHRLSHPESGLPGLTCLAAGRPSIFINDACFRRLQENDPLYSDSAVEDDIMQVCAHELGHALMHRKEMKLAPIKEYEIFNVRTQMEVEANSFAAGIRIDTAEMLDLLNSRLTILQVASAMHVNINLIIYRLDQLRRTGYHLPNIPKNSGFMGRIHETGTAGI